MNEKLLRCPDKKNTRRQHSKRAVFSVAVLTDRAVTPPRKLAKFITVKNSFWLKYPKNVLFSFENKISDGVARQALKNLQSHAYCLISDSFIKRSNYPKYRLPNSNYLAGFFCELYDEPKMGFSCFEGGPRRAYPNP